MWLLKLATLLGLLQSIVFCQKYDSKKEMEKRVRKMRNVCDQNRDEFEELSAEVPDPSKNYVQNWASKLFVCVPAENGAVYWNRVFRQMHNFDLKRFGTFNHSEQFTMTQDELKNFFIESHKSIVVRHPMERLLSNYLTIFRMTDAHVHYGISNYIKKHWLNVRQDRIEPREEEIKVDVKSRPTLTFRQFVHFILHCPKEIESCPTWFSKGVGERWKPMWAYCNPCVDPMQLDSIIQFEHINEDKDFVFAQVGLPYNFVWSSSPEESAQSEPTQKRYFATLTKSEILQLYEETFLDHELFGYSPDKFVAFGR